MVTACITEIHCPVACLRCVSPTADNAVSACWRLPNKMGFAVQSLWQIVARGSSRSTWTWSGEACWMESFATCSTIALLGGCEVERLSVCTGGSY